MKRINREKIKENILNEMNYHDVILVLKDNAYGMGLSKIGRIAVACGVNKFCVNSIQEGIILRKIFPEVMILILGIPTRNYKVLKEYNLTVSVNTFEEYIFFQQHQINMHIKVDMGMNRFGFHEIYQDILQSDFVKGIYMHTPTTNPRINRHLVQSFIYKVGKTDKLIHLGGSSMLSLELPYCIRFGMAIYKDAVSLVGKIIALRVIKKGQGVGYDSAFVASEDTLIGICNVGYAAGLSRNNYGSSYVYIKKHKYKVVGNKCMDHCFILVDKHVNLMDDVEFLGDNISLTEFAKMNNKNSYEALLNIR